MPHQRNLISGVLSPLDQLVARSFCLIELALGVEHFVDDVVESLTSSAAAQVRHLLALIRSATKQSSCLTAEALQRLRRGCQSRCQAHTSLVLCSLSLQLLKLRLSSAVLLDQPGRTDPHVIRKLQMRQRSLNAPFVQLFSLGNVTVLQLLALLPQWARAHQRSDGVIRLRQCHLVLPACGGKVHLHCLLLHSKKIGSLVCHKRPLAQDAFVFLMRMCYAALDDVDERVHVCHLSCFGLHVLLLLIKHRLHVHHARQHTTRIQGDTVWHTHLERLHLPAVQHASNDFVALRLELFFEPQERCIRIRQACIERSSRIAMLAKAGLGGGSSLLR